MDRQSLAGLFDELEKIALSRKLIGKAHTKAMNAAKKLRERAETARWMKQPEKAEKLNKEFDRHRRLILRLESKMDDAVLSKKLNRRVRGKVQTIPDNIDPRRVSHPYQQISTDPDHIPTKPPISEMIKREAEEKASREAGRLEMLRNARTPVQQVPAAASAPTRTVAVAPALRMAGSPYDPKWVPGLGYRVRN